MKGPITEDFILHLGKRKKLDDIKSLDLSNHSLENLDVSLFNKLTSLEALDLSWNRLTEIPKDLVLNNLRVLDCSNNELRSVNFLSQFGNMEELYIDDNEDLSVDDMFIAKVLCPKLRRMDDMPDLSNITAGIKLCRDQLTPQIQAVWEAKYSEVYGSGVDSSEVDRLHEDFIQAVKGAILDFNSDHPEFRQFMICKISREIIEGTNQKKVKEEKSRNSSTQNTPNSKYRTRIKLGTTPVKDYSQGVPMDIDDLPDKGTDKACNSKKRKRESLSSVSPSAKRKRTDTPEKHSAMKDKNSAIGEFTVLKKKSDLAELKLPILPDYDPVQFLRCHSDDNDAADCETKVWKCAFEPTGTQQGETGETVATCGGRIVCFVDCHTCKVMKRYKDNSDTESFYCLSWTTIKADGDSLKEDANILAVAGQDGIIKLIYPRQLVKYAALEGHKDYISALVFHPHHENILFSASRDGRIIQWDIGVPDFKDYKSTKWSQLSTLCLNKTDAISMVISPDLNILLTGCEKSCFGWKLDDIRDNAVNILPHFEFIHPKHKEDKDEITTVDSLSVLRNNNIVSKCVGSSSLFLWNLEHHLKGIKKSSGMKKITIANVQQLDYVPVEVDYLYANTCKDILTVGDDKGNIYMYNLKQTLQKNSIKESQLLQASNILPYPEIELDPKYQSALKDLVGEEEVVVNCVALSSSQEYLVCGTDNNLVCIWRKNS